MSTLIEWFQSAKGELLTAAGAGAIVSTVMEWEGIVPAIRRLTVGVLTAYFLGPVGVPIFAWVFGKVAIPQEQATSVGGFLMGVGGIVIIEIILKTLRFRRDRISGGGDQNGEG